MYLIRPRRCATTAEYRSTFCVGMHMVKKCVYKIYARYDYSVHYLHQRLEHVLLSPWNEQCKLEAYNFAGR